MNGFAPEILPWCDKKFQKTLHLFIQQLQQVSNNVKTHGSKLFHILPPVAAISVQSMTFQIYWNSYPQSNQLLIFVTTRI